MCTTDRPDMVPTRMSCPVINGLANRFVCPTWTWAGPAGARVDRVAGRRRIDLSPIPAAGDDG